MALFSSALFAESCRESCQRPKAAVTVENLKITNLANKMSSQTKVYSSENSNNDKFAHMGCKRSRGANVLAVVVFFFVAIFLVVEKTGILTCRGHCIVLYPGLAPSFTFLFHLFAIILGTQYFLPPSFPVGNILQIVSTPGQQILRPPGSLVMQPVPQPVPVQNSTGPQTHLPPATPTPPAQGENPHFHVSMRVFILKKKESMA